MEARQRPLFALGLRLAAALAMASLLVLIKRVGESGVALPEIIFWRQALTAPSIFVWLLARGDVARLKTRRIGSHAARAGLGMFNMGFSFTAAILLPLAEATALSFTTPLFAVVIGGAVLRQPVGRWRWLSVVLGFAGVLIIARPGGGEAVSMAGVAAGLSAGLMIAVINFQIRDLGRTEEPLTTVFWFSVFGTPMAACALPWFASAHSGGQWLLLLGVGAMGTIYQLFMTASLRFGAVASVVVMDYTGLVWASLYGWLIWHHLPGPATWVGAPLIAAAGLVIAWREHKVARRLAESRGELYAAEVI